MKLQNEKFFLNHIASMATIKICQLCNAIKLIYVYMIVAWEPNEESALPTF